MEPNAFIGKKKKPTARELALALGPALPLWEKLLAELQLEPEWNSYSLKTGWALKLKRGTRTIFYLSPCARCFRASFVLGNKALGAAKACDLSDRVLKLVSAGQKYPEGIAVRFEPVTAGDVPSIKTLTQVKMDH